MLELSRKYWWAAIAGFLAVFSASPALAVVFQDSKTTGSGALSGADLLNVKENFIAPPETVGQNIASITINFKSNNGCKYILKKAAGATIISSDEVTTTAGVVNDYTFNFSNSSTVTTGNLTSFNLDAGGSPGDGCYGSTANFAGEIYGAATTSTYPNGYVTPSLPVKNLYFYLNNNPANVYIDFSSRPTPRGEFSSWSLETNLVANTSTIVICTLQKAFGTPCQFAVWYQNASTSQIYIDQVGFDPNVFTNNPQQITIRKQTTFVTGTAWLARAYIWQSAYQSGSGVYPTTLAQSSDYLFLINNGTTSGLTSWFYFNPATSSASAGSIYDCETGHNWFTSGMCNMFLVLFYPSQDSLNQYSEAISLLQNKPPFGYFTIYANAINGLTESNSSTTSTLAGNVDLTPVNSVLSEIEPLQWARTLVGYLIWLTFGWYLYQRFKHFSFE